MLHSTMKQAIPQTSKRRTYLWFFYANSFLGLAKIGCYELLEEKYQNYRPHTSELLYNDEATHANHLLLSIFFNIHHALELYIKAVGITLDGTYWKHHNINLLLNDFDDKVNLLVDLNKPENERILVLLLKAKEIIRKYFKWDFFEYSKTHDLTDTQNILFKYPESDNQVLTDFSNFFNPNRTSVFEEFRTFRVRKIEDIIDDINNVNQLFLALDSHIKQLKK